MGTRAGKRSELASCGLVQQIQNVDGPLLRSEAAKRGILRRPKYGLSLTQLNVIGRQAATCNMTKTVVFANYQSSKLGFADACRVLQYRIENGVPKCSFLCLKTTG